MDMQNGAEFEQVKKGVVKRKQKRSIGLFIDGTGLDRATRRIQRKVDMPALVRGVTSGMVPTVARYYTLIPYEDDSRQLAFLDAIGKAGLQVIVKRLPPKGVTRQVSVDSLMAADIVAFALGHAQFSDLSQYEPAKENRTDTSPSAANGAIPLKLGQNESDTTEQETVDNASKSPTSEQNCKRIITVVCPGRELSYPISLSSELGVDTVTADFGQFNTGDVLKSAAKWIDLSDSETIWMD